MPRFAAIILMAVLIWLSPIEGARTYIVDDNGFANYKTIQEAVIASSDGDTIFIKPGTYSEEVVLNRSVSLTPLTGEKDPVILRGDGKKTGITITSDGCTLEGLSFENYTGPGINVESSSNVIKKNSFEKVNPAILMTDSRSNTITRNSMKDCQGAVAVWQNSTENEIFDNKIEGGVVFAVVRDTGKNSITGNHVAGSSMGVWLMNSSGSEIIGNDIDAKTYGIWIFNSTSGLLADNVLSSGTRGIYVMNSSGQQVTNNSIHGASIGVVLENSRQNGVSGCSILESGHGIYLRNSSDQQIQGDRILDAEFGIALENSSRNQIGGCSIENSTRALGLAMSNRNIIKGNSIRNSQDTAVEVDYSAYNSLLDNTIIGGDKGIIMMDSPSNVLQDNQMQGLKWGLYVESSEKEGFNNSIDQSNLVDGKPIAYLYAQSGGQIKDKKFAHLTLAYCDNFTVERVDITSDAIFLFSANDNRILDNNASSCYGMRLIGSGGNDISGNRLLGNRYSGLFMVSSNSNQIARNNASGNNQNGISLLDCSQNTIQGNEIEGNFEAGLWLNLSHNNLIYRNNITDNPLGMDLQNSMGNAIYNNNFVHNKEHARDLYGNNSWDQGATVGGNYWSGHSAKGNPSQNWPNIVKGGKMDNFPFQDESGWLKAASAAPLSGMNDTAAEKS